MKAVVQKSSSKKRKVSSTKNVAPAFDIKFKVDVSSKNFKLVSIIFEFNVGVKFSLGCSFQVDM